MQEAADKADSDSTAQNEETRPSGPTPEGCKGARDALEALVAAEKLGGNFRLVGKLRAELDSALLCADLRTCLQLLASSYKKQSAAVVSGHVARLLDESDPDLGSCADVIKTLELSPFQLPSTCAAVGGALLQLHGSFGLASVHHLANRLAAVHHATALIPGEAV